VRALLLAAGLGTRLRPICDYLPKCLVPIHGRPLLDYWLESLFAHNVSEVMINTHYLAPLVVEFLERSGWRDRVRISHEETLLGTGGTILRHRAFLGNEPFLVAHADNLTDFDSTAFVARHADRPSGIEMTMMLFEAPEPSSAGIVELDQYGVVVGFHEKVPSPPGKLGNAAVYMMDPSVVELMAGFGKTDIDFSTEVIPQLMGRISTWKNSTYHRDIGTIESWTEAHRDFPPILGSRESREAWSGIMDSLDENLRVIMSRLLTHAHSNDTRRESNGTLSEAAS
jgi:mannose-1-phosphate guanylyltransferase